MNRLTNWNPFRSLSKFNAPSTVEDLFKDFGMRPAWSEFETMPDIKIDVREDDRNYFIRADIPGVKKEDIEINVDGRLISITANMQQESECKQGDCLYAERSTGKVFRSFTLPFETDSRNSKAHYENGVLSLELPKKADANNRRITVN